MNENVIKPVAWADPEDVENLGFEDGNTYPGIRRHETYAHTMALYSQAAVDELRAQLLKVMGGAFQAQAELKEWKGAAEVLQHKVAGLERAMEPACAEAIEMRHFAVHQRRRAEKLAKALRAAWVVLDVECPNHKATDDAFIALQEPAGEPPSTSATTQQLIEQIIERDRKGLAKYGTTLDRTDLTPEQWLQHMAEELMDGAGYALAAIRTLREGKA